MVYTMEDEAEGSERLEHISPRYILRGGDATLIIICISSPDKEAVQTRACPVSDVTAEICPNSRTLFDKMRVG